MRDVFCEVRGRIMCGRNPCPRGWMYMTSAVPPRWSEPLQYRHGADSVIHLAPPEQAGVFTRFVLGVLDRMKITSRGHYTESAERLPK